MTNAIEGLYNQCKISSKVKIGSGEYVDTDVMVDISVIAIQKDRTEKRIILHNVKYASRLFCKLISLTTILNITIKMNLCHKHSISVLRAEIENQLGWKSSWARGACKPSYWEFTLNPWAAQ